MPSEIGSSLNEYLSTLGELEGFIDSHPCDNTFLVGDFNVDFTRGGPLKDLLTDFVSELNLCVRDLDYQTSVNYTFESNDGLSRSWIDHIVCSRLSSSI